MGVRVQGSGWVRAEGEGHGGARVAVEADQLADGGEEQRAVLGAA